MKIKSILMFTLLSLSSLTACNKGKSTYTITWNNYDGTTLEVDRGVKYGATPSYDGAIPTKPSTEKYQYEFSGWSPSIVSVTSDATYIAQFSQSIRKYGVTLHANDSSMGSVSGEGIFDYGTNITVTATPNNGYKFIGWYSDSSYSSQVSTSESYTFSLSSSNKDLYAKFELETYTITYNLNGGTNHSDNPSTYTIKDAVTFKDPSKTKNSFVNWTDENGNTIIGISKGTTGNITINANWKINQYSVVLHVNDSKMGSVSGGGTFDYGSSLTVIATPNEGYRLEGWYSDSLYSNKLSINKSYTFTLPDENLDLYVKFVESSLEWNEKHGVIPVINTTDNTLTYGLFPQTIVSTKTESSLITELDKLVTSTYNYVYYNDEYYAKVSSANPYLNDYTFSDGTTIVSGNMYYFKCEPIKWNIISSNNGTYYIDCTNILNAQRYGEKYFPSKSKTDYKGETATVYANNYKYSDIRTYLNTTFYNQAFFLNNGYIIDTTVDNSASTTDSSTNEYACENTVDKVFLRSYKDLSSISESNRVKKVTDFSLANYAYMNTYSCPRNGMYWPRSPYSLHALYVWLVIENGYLDDYGVDDAAIGVSPALNINLTNLLV